MVLERATEDNVGDKSQDSLNILDSSVVVSCLRFKLEYANLYHTRYSLSENMCCVLRCRRACGFLDVCVLSSWVLFLL